MSSERIFGVVATPLFAKISLSNLSKWIKDGFLVNLFVLKIINNDNFILRNVKYNQSYAYNQSDN